MIQIAMGSFDLRAVLVRNYAHQLKVANGMETRSAIPFDLHKMQSQD